jgi:hypothetical protein
VVRPRSLAVSVVVGVGAICALVAVAGTGRESPGAQAQPARPGSVGRVAGARPPRTSYPRGRQFYVSTGGSDTAVGSRAHPWRTIGYAASQARPGATVHVAPGSYAGPLLIERGGTARRPLRFLSDRRWGARITAGSPGPILIVNIRGDHVTFQDFDVSGSGGDGSAAISANGTNDAILGNHVHDLAAPCLKGGGDGAAGIVVAGDGYRLRGGLVDGNLVERIGSGPRDGSCRLVHGIYASVPDVRISNNVTSDAAGDGITSWHAARSLTIANNLSVFNGGSGILVGSGDAGATTGNTRTLVANNIVYRNERAGITESTDGGHRVGPGNRYLHNLAFMNGSSGLGDLSPAAMVSDTLSRDPGLGQKGQGARRRFCLSSGSPVVDAGTRLGAPTRDFDGKRRPRGRTVDIGPYELPAGSCAR